MNTFQFVAVTVAGVAVVQGPPPYPLLLPSIVSGALALAIALGARHAEETAAPAWWRHARHCALVYPMLLVAALSQGEGLTAPVGPLLLAVVASTVAADLLTLAVGRTRRADNE